MATVNTEITLTGDVTQKPKFCHIPVAALRSRYPDLAHVPVNSYVCPVGQASGRAWVLMNRGDLDVLTTADKAGNTDASFTLSMKAIVTNKEETASLPQLLLVKAVRLEIGAPDDPDSLYIVELADKRYLLERWADSGVVLANIRSHAQDTDYLTSTAKTWNQLIEAVWNTMDHVLGAYSDTITSDAVPEGWDIRGENAWGALHVLLGKLGKTVAYDPIGATYSIVDFAAAQPIPASYDVELLRDAEPIEHNATRFPETIRVYFRVHYKSYGQERDTELGTNWQVEGDKATKSKDVATNITGAITDTILPLWDDLPLVLDEDSAEANDAALVTRAAAVAASWVADASVDRAFRTYAGFKTDVLPGGTIKSIRWQHKGDGPKTIITQRQGFPAAIRNGDDTLGLAEMLDTQEELRTPDLSRGTFPNFPRLPNVVKVDDGSSDTGDVVAPNASDLFPGFVQRWVSGSIAELEACWIRPVDLETGASPSEATIISLRQDDKYLGRLSGIETVSGDTRPIYLIRSGGGERITMISDCVTYGSWAVVAEGAEIQDVRSITVARNSSLRLLEQADGLALLDIDDGPSGSVFWSGGLNPPKWHTSPSLNTSLQIGTSTSGFLNLGSFTTLMTGDLVGNAQSIRFPNTLPPGIHSYLYVDRLANTRSCIQTEWSPQGITGNFYVYAEECEDEPICRLIEVEKGLVIGITGISPPDPGDQGAVTCLAVQDDPFDPCSP